VRALCERITRSTGLAALTQEEFQWKSMLYFLKYTGVPINFGMSVLLGFLVGTIVAGMTFFNFTLDNLRYFGALKAMGSGSRQLIRMILLQAMLVGLLGWGIGVGGAALFGRLTAHTELAFRMPWQLLAISGTAVLLICAISAVLCIWKVVRLEPAIVFKS
jgi:putative ABC transport system permease protein